MSSNVAEVAVERKVSLLEILDGIRDLFDLLESAETEEERVVAAAEIERVLSAELPDKIDAIGWFLRRCDSDVELRKQMMADVRDSLARCEARKERARGMLRYVMGKHGLTSVKGNLFTASLRPGAESVELTGDANVPVEYCTVVPSQLKPDKTAIKRAIKAGESVPGARLVTGDEVLTIR